MKRLICAACLLISINSFSQSVPSGYTGINARYQWLAGEFKAFTMPAGGVTAALRTGQTNHAGALILDSVNHIVWYYSGSEWRRLGTVFNVATGYGLTGGPITGTGTLLADTATLFSRAFLTFALTTTGTGAATWNNTARILNIPTPVLSTYYNSNIGAGYRWAVPNTNNIKTVFGAGILTIDSTTNTNALTFTATEVDGSITNELQTLANTSDATSHTTTLSGSGGSTQFVEGSGITIATTGTTLNGIATITAVDASTTNEIQTISAGGSTSPTIDLSIGGGTVTFNGAGITALSRSSNTITITSTEVDGSTSNEIQSLSAGGSTSPTIDLSIGGGTITFNSAGIASLSRSSNTITITATEVDGSTSNELQTISNTSDATSHTVTLSNSGGSVQLIEGTGITLTTGGSGSAGTLTIASTSVADVTATDANGFDFTMSGTTTKNIALTTTLTAGSVFFAGSGGAINEDNNNFYWDNTDNFLGIGVSAAPTVTLDVYRNTAEVYVARFINEGGNGVYVSGNGSSLFEVAEESTPRFAVNNFGAISFSGSAGSSGQIPKSNGASAAVTWVNPSTLFTESQTISAGGSLSPWIELSGGGGQVTFDPGGIVSLSRSSSVITITATEVDGSTTNEIQTVTGTSNRISVSGGGGMTPTIDIHSSYVGQSSITTLGTITTGVWNGTDIAYSNIAQLSANSLLGNSTGSTADIGAVGLGAGLSMSGGNVVATDPSTTNEIQTFTSSNDGLSTMTWTLASGGSLTLNAGTGIYFSIGGNSANPEVTINLVSAPYPKPKP